MQKIEVPGMGLVEFPDGMSDDDIAAAIRKNMPAQSMWGKAVSDIPNEMERTAKEHLGNIDRGLLNNPQKSAIGGLLDTGRGLLSLPGLVLDTAIGAPARSLAGHTLANASHKIGEQINPEVAAKDNLGQMYEDFRPGVDQAMSALAPRSASPRGLRTGPPNTAQVSQQLRDAGTSVYNDPAVKNAQALPPDVANLSTAIEQELIQKGFRPTTGSAPGTFAEVNRMMPPGFQPGGPGIGPVTSISVDDLRAVTRALGQTAKQTADFKATPDAKAAVLAKNKVNDFLETLAPGLKEANQNYSRGEMLRELDFRTIKRDREAAKSGSGSNLENKMRSVADDVLKMRGLKPDEAELADKIVRGTPARNALRKVGKLGISDGLSALIHMLGAPTSGGLTVPIAAAGTTARRVGESLTRRQLQQLSDLLASKAPQKAVPVPLPPPNVSKALAAALLGDVRAPLMYGAIPARADQDQR
jgi:hypothetical protein